LKVLVVVVAAAVVAHSYNVILLTY